MKIALVNNYYYLRGGCERVMFGDQQALLAAGHEVLPFAPRDERNEAASSQSFFPAVSNALTAKRTRLIKAAMDVVYSPSVGRAFGEFLDELRPDVIHCHNIYGRLTTAILDEAQRRDIPIVLTVHDQKLVCPAYLGLREGKPCQLCRDGGYWRCALWKCHKQSRSGSLVYATEAYFNRFGGKYDAVSRFLCPSRFMQNSLIESGIAPERTIYHPNALEPQEFMPRYRVGEYVLYAGRLSAEKGIMTLLEAIERTRIPLRIAGAGPLDSAVRERIERLKLPVRMEGHSSGERLSELYREAAFILVPSECYENAPMSALESFAYGKPVLASRIGGNPELVIEGRSGHLFSPGDITELSTAARSMWNDREELVRMGKGARALIEREFAQENRLANLLRIYGEVCGHLTPTSKRFVPIGTERKK